MLNNIALDLEENDDLVDFFQDKEVGESCTINVKFTIAEKSDSRLSGTVESIAKGEEMFDEEEEDEESETKSKKTEVIHVGVGKGKKEEEE